MLVAASMHVAGRRRAAPIDAAASTTASAAAGGSDTRWRRAAGAAVCARAPSTPPGSLEAVEAEMEVEVAGPRAARQPRSARRSPRTSAVSSPRCTRSPATPSSAPLKRRQKRSSAPSGARP
ncbi:hypothetical protein R5R35_009868 [Gryllus longicercus]|uniref:Uncharacterized protein n=1 Tax=Gryllus longicercus TaxID=2509291 RepID=A0AAN9VXT5_9ORTH